MYVEMSLMTSQILKFVNFTETQKSRYLEKKTFFLQVKKFNNYISIKGYFIAKNNLVPEVSFN